MQKQKNKCLLYELITLHAFMPTSNKKLLSILALPSWDSNVLKNVEESAQRSPGIGEKYLYDSAKSPCSWHCHPEELMVKCGWILWASGKLLTLYDEGRGCGDPHRLCFGDVLFPITFHNPVYPFISGLLLPQSPPASVHSIDSKSRFPGSLGGSSEQIQFKHTV